MRVSRLRRPVLLVIRRSATAQGSRRWQPRIQSVNPIVGDDRQAKETPSTGWSGRRFDGAQMPELTTPWLVSNQNFVNKKSSCSILCIYV